MRHSFALLCAVMFLVATASQAETVMCTLTPSSNDAGMPPEVVLDFEGGGATIAHGWYEGPLYHEVPVADGGNRRQMGFTLPFPFRTRTVMVHYTAIYFPGQQRLSLNAAAGAGFEGNFRGTFSCAPL